MSIIFRDNGLTEEKILEDWLDKPGMPEVYNMYYLFLTYGGT